MTLIKEFNHTGNILFKYRSYIPLLLFPFATLVVIFNPERILVFSEPYFSILCLSISLIGLLFRILVIGFVPKGTSGRNTNAGQVAETLNTKGIYSAVRHPLYLGNLLMWMGVVLYVGSLWFFIVAALLFWIYYERIMFAEEQFLTTKFGETYINWASKTPPFIPRFKKWKKAELTFSTKNVLKREYNGFFAIFITFTYIDVIKNYLNHQTFMPDTFWLVGLSAGFLAFIVLRTLKRNTNVLQVKGR